ncbi:MAG: 2,3-bisphosphoglycerate-independent phosphoglycerate mutase [Pseudomonadota bacterium]|nr:2,3-bisphosphoglycerate-independent phosphoglycerate mutase [Pseudomonadota bacterium]
MPLIPRPLILAVLDGWGHSDTTEYNAIHSAHKPVWDDLWALYPHTFIGCSGLDVGLPDNQMGNSEVGHMHLGAGRLVLQEFTRITRAVEDGSFFRNENLIAPVDRAVRSGRAIHILGLLSPGGVHSHEAHILAMMDLAAKRGATRIYLHAFLDGRDRPPKSAADSILEAQVKIAATGAGRIASLIGRYFAMDRNHQWSRTQEAYDLIAHGRARYRSTDPFIALDMAYARGEADEFVQATAIVPANGEVVTVADGDVVVFMNFRADRARQLTRAFIEPDFDRFERGRMPAPGAYVSLTRYHADFHIPCAYPPERLHNVLGEYLAHQGLTQLRIAETEKYAHVTYFFNGGEERVFDGEDRILVPSPHVATYDLKPEMSADGITDRLVEAIYSKKYDVIVCNFANADMVGHTGNFEATVKAIEAIDTCLGRIVAAIQAVSGEMLITADHGNAEKMRGVSTKMRRGQPYTAHTRNRVPLLYIGRPAGLARSGTLADIAPTLLYLLGLDPPAEMSGRTLVALEPSQGTCRQSLRPRQRLGRLLR